MCDKIIGLGTDIVDIRRIERLIQQYGNRFVGRIFTSREQARANQYTNFQQKAASYAKRFAAKEAVAKALGTGFNSKILFQDIEIENDKNGKPFAILKGRTLEYLNNFVSQGHQKRLEISISDEYPFAQAFVIFISS